MQELMVATVFVATVAALYLRPFGARDWQVAATGALAAWVLGPLSFHDGLATIGHAWNIVAFFSGLMLLGAGAEAAGLYGGVAALLQRAAPGRSRLLRTLLVGAGVTAVLSNDATPLILTPAVFAAAPSLAAVTDAAFATTFVADGASLILPISNPVNLLFYEQFHLGFRWYMVHIFPAAVVGAAALGAIVWWRSAPRTALEEPAPAIERASGSRTHELFALTVVASLAVAYIAAGILEWPLGLVTLAGGLVLLAGRAVMERRRPSGLRKHISPGLLVFVVSLLVLIEGVSRAGVLDGLASALDGLSGRPAIVTVLGAATVAAVLSNLMNNWPGALLIAATIAVASGAHGPLIAGALIGCTIGANFTMVGSLSTVFWQNLARQRGAAYSPVEYARRAAFPTASALIAASLVAAMTFR